MASLSVLSSTSSFSNSSSAASRSTRSANRKKRKDVPTPFPESTTIVSFTTISLALTTNAAFWAGMPPGENPLHYLYTMQTLLVLAATITLRGFVDPLESIENGLRLVRAGKCAVVLGLNVQIYLGFKASRVLLTPAGLFSMLAKGISEGLQRQQRYFKIFDTQKLINEGKTPTSPERHGIIAANIKNVKALLLRLIEIVRNHSIDEHDLVELSKAANDEGEMKRRTVIARESGRRLLDAGGGVNIFACSEMREFLSKEVHLALCKRVKGYDVDEDGNFHRKEKTMEQMYDLGDDDKWHMKEKTMEQMYELGKDGIGRRMTEKTYAAR